jgi:hypothetical protein
MLSRLLALFLVPWLAALAHAAEPPADWAFHPANRPSVPEVAAAKNPIDAFLLAKLKEQKLAFAPEADRATLLRRVSFDLIGLPPTPAELEAFAADTSPEAYQKVVKRLLRSSQYGERSALFWLDLVRYAESDGFKADDPRPNAWRYRDYVIESFNADKPYDRFIREQLAGDELYPKDAQAQIATGFLRHYPEEYNAVNLEQRRQEILNDITDTVGSAFLGVTLGCCRCHDHKTDPIAQKDYYRIQSHFAGFWPVEVPVDPQAQKAHNEQLKVWNAKTETIRKRMAELEKPYREKAEKKERSRFPEEYANLLDLPEAKRTPMEKQIAAMVAKQVYSDRRFAPTQLKAEEKKEYDALLKDLAAFDADKPKPIAMIHAMTDLGRDVPPTRLLKRGDWRKPDELLAPGCIHVISNKPAKPEPTETTPGRRTTLAKWIASAENPLTARVMVNRIWQQHFGKGIVASSNDLGKTGDRPTHPELLDWLADEFVKSGWSTKYIHELIVTSDAYRQISFDRGNGPKVDPENALLWKYPRRRLDGEALRDALLAVSGQLNSKAGGPSVFPELPTELQKSSQGWKPSADPAERNRRSIYVSVKRNLRYPFFSLFDSPDRFESCSRRFSTTTAPQALALLNDATVIAQAKAMAARVTKEQGGASSAQVRGIYLLAFSRQPTGEEEKIALDYLAEHKGKPAEALADLCHAILNLNEFLTVD